MCHDAISSRNKSNCTRNNSPKTTNHSSNLLHRLRITSLSRESARKITSLPAGLMTKKWLMSLHLSHFPQRTEKIHFARKWLSPQPSWAVYNIFIVSSTGNNHLHVLIYFDKWNNLRALPSLYLLDALFSISHWMHTCELKAFCKWIDSVEWESERADLF